MKRRYDKARIDIRLQPGDKVLVALTDKQRSKYPVRKLAPRWGPPATVVSSLAHGKTYVVKTATGDQTVSITRLLPLTGTIWGKLFPPADKSTPAAARKTASPETICEPCSGEDDVEWTFEWIPSSSGEHTTTRISSPTASVAPPATSPPATRIATPPEARYTIERITGRRKRQHRVHFRVKWAGCDETTWEPRTILMEDAPKLVREYEQRRKSKHS